jgi:trimethylamine---corrinoid protein Co-methyltransferase
VAESSGGTAAVRPAERRRVGQGNRPSDPPQITAFREGAFARRPTFGVLDEGGIARLKARVLDLLESHGVIVIHKEAHARLVRAGFTEGSDSRRLRIPRELVAEALAATPKSVTLCGKSPEFDLHLPRADGGFVMRTGTGAHGFVDPVTAKYRNMQVADVATIAAVANHLDEVGFIAPPFVHGVPEITADIHSYAALTARTRKHVWMQPYNKENVAYLLRLAAIAAGGEAQLRARPITSCIVCSFTPLEFKVMDLEAMIQCGKYGVPIHACSLPSAGGTGPITVPGMVLMAAAEITAMVTMAHILAPGTAVIATPLMFTLDMRTGRSLQSCAESLQAAAMAITFMKRGLGLLAHTYGAGSDTPDVDVQSLAERALLGETVALAGADILGGVGQLECATVFSPVQAVLDNEVGGMLRKLIRVPEIDDEAFNWPEVSVMRGGGHFLDSAHTLKYCREQYRPRVFLRENRDDYEKSQRRTAIDNARDICLELMGRAPPAGLPGTDQLAAMTAMVAEADREIVGAAEASKGARAEI